MWRPRGQHNSVQESYMMCGKSFLLEIHVGRHINFEIDLQNLAFCQ